MADNSYPIEMKPASQYINGSQRWFTPAESNAYYATRYSREGITIHWWGDGTGADNHDNIVNYFLRRTDGSVNYVLSDNKITYMVSPDNVAFCSQSGNPTTISIEHQPTLGAEGYKKSGWLVDQLEQRYGRRLTLYPHNRWYPTACPGSIDINRIRVEADKWKSGAYDAPTPPPTPPVKPVEPPKPAPSINLEITDIVNKKVRLIRDTSLWDLHFTKYADAKSIKTLSKGTEIEVSATAKHPLGSTYYLSEYSFSKGIGNGINVKDCEDVDVEKPATTLPPVEIPIPTVPPPTVPTKDDEQDARLNALEKAVKAIVDFLSGLFSGFKKG